MGLFSKEECCLCKKNVGLLKRKKLQDKNFVCTDCEKNTSAFFEISKYNEEIVKENIEYMKKQDILYKKEYEPLTKKETERHICVDSGIVFADTIGMFEVISRESKKRNYHELFRYDMIDHYEKYEVENTDTQEGAKRFSESGIIIRMKCKRGFSSLGKTDNELEHVHPFVEEFKIKLEGPSDSGIGYKHAINHLDAIFLKEPTYKSFGETVKDDIIGTQTERRHAKEGREELKNLMSMAGAKIKGDEVGMSQAKENLQNAFINNVHEAFHACDRRYTTLADEAEKRAWDV